MDDDCGWCDDTSTTVLATSKGEMNWESFLSSLNACFKFFCFLLPFYFLSHCALTFCIFIFPPYLLPVPVLSLLTASFLSQLFFPWLYLSFYPQVFISSEGFANHSMWTCSADEIRTSDSLRAGKSHLWAIITSLPTRQDPDKTQARRRIEQCSLEHLATKVAR